MSNNLPEAGIGLGGKPEDARPAPDGRSGRSRRRSRGSAILELTLMMPWIVFLFVGALDWGFYAYELITLETAARSAAVYESALGSANVTTASACTIVLNEMSTLINMGSVTGCGSSPLVVSATTGIGPDNANAVLVSVTYTTPQMIPIPGILAGKFTITRTVQFRMSS